MLESSKNYTGSKLLTFNDNMSDMFHQVDAALVALTNRVAALENSVGLFYLDEDDDVCQRDIETNEEE